MTWNNRRSWTTEEIDLLKKHWTKHGPSIPGLDRSEDAVERKARRLKLPRRADRISKPGSRKRFQRPQTRQSSREKQLQAQLQETISNVILDARPEIENARDKEQGISITPLALDRLSEFEEYAEIKKDPSDSTIQYLWIDKAVPLGEPEALTYVMKKFGLGNRPDRVRCRALYPDLELGDYQVDQSKTPVLVAVDSTIVTVLRLSEFTRATRACSLVPVQQSSGGGVEKTRRVVESRVSRTMELCMSGRGLADLLDIPGGVSYTIRCGSSGALNLSGNDIIVVRWREDESQPGQPLPDPDGGGNGSNPTRE